MSYPNPDDIKAIGGAHPGTQSQAEIEAALVKLNETKVYNRLQAREKIKKIRELEDKLYAAKGIKPPLERETVVTVSPSPVDELSEQAAATLKAAEWKMETFSDSNASPKYAVSSENHYLAGGTVSSTPDGNFAVSDNSNEIQKPVLSSSKNKSKFYSDSTSTTVGSLDINTKDGYELNKLSPVFPSTNYSPTKPWVKQIFPYLYDTEAMTFYITEIVVGALFVLLDKQVSKGKTSENTTRKQSEKDMVLIIQDNQIIEDQLFDRNTQPS